MFRFQHSNGSELWSNQPTVVSMWPTTRVLTTARPSHCSRSHDVFTRLKSAYYVQCRVTQPAPCTTVSELHTWYCASRLRDSHLDPKFVTSLVVSPPAFFRKWLAFPRNNTSLLWLGAKRAGPNVGGAAGSKIIARKMFLLLYDCNCDQINKLWSRLILYGSEPLLARPLRTGTRHFLPNLSTLHLFLDTISSLISVVLLFTIT